MVLQSWHPGRYSPDYTQFDTVRKLLSPFSNHCCVAAEANCVSFALGDQKGRYCWNLTYLCMTRNHFDASVIQTDHIFQPNFPIRYSNPELGF
jgi:hypothetical protein